MDSSPSTLLESTNTLLARASSSDSSGRPSYFKAVGISLAVASGLFIGVSFVLKKLGLLKANAKYNEEAGEGYGYLRNLWWWSGMTLMILGEICNFVAYAFVDAILVTPLGALSVVVTTILSAIFLKERLSFVGKVGCFNCIVGSVVIVLNAPQQSAVKDIQQMQNLVVTPGFLTYAGIIIVGCAVVAFYVGPRWGKKSMLVYITICSLIGGLSVVSTQGLGASIIAQISGEEQFDQPFLYILFVFVIATLLTEIIYLNKALNIFNAALVTPTYYVYFTSATIVTSAVLFQGFNGSPLDIVTVVLGFLQICTGVVLLQLSKSSKDVPDTAVFQGDLDQVRTVAEQEEPEYEPRADTIRGSGALIRSFSKQREKRQTQELKRLQEERMQPISENEIVEWDGLRRRTTIIGSKDGEQFPMSPMRRRSMGKSQHPPLGMSYFPEDHPDEESGPSQTRSRSHRSRGAWLPSPMRREHNHASAQAQLAGERPPPTPHNPQSASSTQQNEDFEKDTEYHPRTPGGGIKWADESGGNISRQYDGANDPPPPVPPHSARRQFSFQNMFRRKSTDDSQGESPHGSARARDASGYNQSRGQAVQNFSRKGARNPRASEEEHYGLVKGGGSDQGRSSTESDESYLGPEQRPETMSPPHYLQNDGYLVPRLRPLSTFTNKPEYDSDLESEDEKGKGWRRHEEDESGGAAHPGEGRGAAHPGEGQMF